MACQCLNEIDAELAGRNTRLIRTVVLSGYRATATIAVEKIAPRGEAPVSCVPTYCPFCGVAYEAQPAAPATPEVPAHG